MDLEQRVTRPERTVTELRERHDLEARHSADRDRDTADAVLRMRALERSMGALRETQVEHGQVLDEHTRTLAEHTRTLADHGRVLAELREGQAVIVGLLTQLIEREG